MNDSEDLVYLHALHVGLNQSLSRLRTLLERYNSPREAFRHAALGLIDPRLEWDKYETLFRDGAFGLQLIDRSSATYPQRLSSMPKPPSLLYCRGNTALLNAKATMAIVGSRKATAYGRQVVADAIEMLAAGTIATVSGLAFGIDQIVHEQTLMQHGQTIAVLGSSVVDGEITPPRNHGLAQRILENNGLLVSEYPPGTPVQARFFPERNQIIAGLADSTLVVEAALKSGALITARAAVESGRDVFAVPGSIYAPLSEGCNQLIATGAIPWLSSKTLAETDPHLELGYHHASLEDKKIIDCCTNESCTIDQFIDKTGLPPHLVLERITDLQLRGVLRSDGAERYRVAI